MKTITNDFKNALKRIKEVDSIVTYTINNVEYELSSEQLNSIQPHYEADILMSAMRELDLDSNVSIPNGTEINLQVGLKVRYADVDESIPNDYRKNYDYVNYGNYIVYSNEKQEDTNSYLIKCYDKMLYSMVDYESMGITYPITVRNYITAICNHLGLTFKNANDTFVNYNKMIPSELYLDAQGNSLNYKFRDVLTELAQVTASTICINEEDDELEIRYINNTNDIMDEELFDETNVKFGELYGPINTVVLSRSADSDIYTKSIPADLADDLKVSIKIKDNQIMNFDNRGLFVDEILNQLNGLSYYSCDYSSKGVLYYNMCDKYTASIFGRTYTCIMLKDDVTIENGIKENVSTDVPKQSEPDYSKSTSDDKADRTTKLVVDKVNKIIQSEISDISDIKAIVIGVYGLTEDTTFQADKNYYILNSDNEYELYENYTVGDTIPADTIYELTGSKIQELSDNYGKLDQKIDDVNDETITEMQRYTDSQIIQSKNEIEVSFNTRYSDYTDMNVETNGRIDEIHQYLKYVQSDNSVRLGISTEDMELVLKNNKMAFYDKSSGEEVAYISENKLYITNAQILTAIQIGNFAFIPRDNGSLGFRKVS